MSDEPLIVGPESAVAPARAATRAGSRPPDRLDLRRGIAALHLLALLAPRAVVFLKLGRLSCSCRSAWATFGTPRASISASIACRRASQSRVSALAGAHLVLMGTRLDGPPAYWVAWSTAATISFADEERGSAQPDGELSGRTWAGTW